MRRRPQPWPFPAPTRRTKRGAAFDAMPIAELAARWRMLQFVGVKQQTEETWAADALFRQPSARGAARAPMTWCLPCMAAETDMSVRLRLHDVMATLVHAHGALLVDRIVADADGQSPRCAGCWAAAAGGRRTRRWRRRLAAVADVDAFRADLRIPQDAQRARRFRRVVDR